MNRLLLTSIAALFLATGTAHANAGELHCLVADPTGTPMNVRVKPNGAIRGALYNQTDVLVLDESKDHKWVRIVPTAEGKSGWVFFNYLDSCVWTYSRQ